MQCILSFYCGFLCMTLICKSNFVFNSIAPATVAPVLCTLAYHSQTLQPSGRPSSPSWAAHDGVNKWSDIPCLDPRTVHFGKILGRGASSTVYRATVEGTDVALKVIHNDAGNISTAPLDMHLAKHVDHPNVMKVLGVYQKCRYSFIGSVSTGQETSGYGDAILSVWGVYRFQLPSSFIILLSQWDFP